ncbi:MAG: NADP-dependent isocitrate dehydrogenase [Spirochaetaceae bacterium]|jgi:isocitrate dehydrogenase|nr:NADP-dependent isocitrate dehydrogenase [Spirochaetaceae bacterium]
MVKIKMKNPVVEMNGDEMTRELWAMIKEELLLPFVELSTEYYDLGIMSRDASNDAVTYSAAEAIRRHKVGVKCATITANEARKAEYNLKTAWPSPNATIRAALDGTVFRKPVAVSNIPPAVKSWKKPIIIARHAYGDVYKAVEMAIPGPGKVELFYTPAQGGGQRRISVAEMPGAGVVQAMHNLEASIESFARSCFTLACGEKLPVLFAAKDTISKTYDGAFKAVFERIYSDEFKTHGVEYSYTLIDDAIARVMRSEGGFIWACKNYDGDVMSDMLASASGSLAMMTSVLVSPSGAYEFEAAHGTVQRHYYRWRNGERTSTNPCALIFAWSGALAKRAALDGDGALAGFAARLEAAVLGAIEAGRMTADLAALAVKKPERALDSLEFIREAAARLAGMEAL